MGRCLKKKQRKINSGAGLNHVHMQPRSEVEISNHVAYLLINPSTVRKGARVGSSELFETN